jgi:RND family efflux transporter MFP subunit
MTGRALAAVLTAGVSVASAACGTAAVAERQPIPVRVEALGPVASGSGAVRYAASIEAYDVTPLSFRVGGYLVALAERRGGDGRLRAIQEGDRVSRGEVLARLRATEYDAQVEQVRSRVAEAQAGLAKARQDRDRAQRLFDKRSLTRPELEGATAAYEAAMARVGAAAAGLAEAQAARGDTALRAPIAGVVLARRPEPGVLVGPGVEVVRLGTTGHVRALFGVPDLALAALQVGQRLAVELDATNERVEGTVSAIAPAADAQSRAFTVELRLDNAEGRLRPGMIASVEVPGGAPPAPAPARLSVPLSAVVRAPGERDAFAVFILDGSAARAIARARTVTLGDVAGDRVSVLGGVTAGARVVVTGAALVHDGDRVRVIP